MVRSIALAVTATLILVGSTRERASAMSADSAPPLPAPTGSVVNVSTVAQLESAISAITSNQTILIAPGTYNLNNTLWINRAVVNAAIRGATNNRNDVVLVGRGMGVPDAAVPYGIWAGSGVTGLTIANLTIHSVYRHALMFNPGSQAPRIYNVRIADVGEQLLKANPDGAGGGVDNGIVEYSVIEYTNTSPTDYTNGVDVHTGDNWIIRHNLFRRVRSPAGTLAGPAILMWNGSTNTLVEGNTFIDCHRDISIGLSERPAYDHVGGIVRNNFIFRSAGSGGDVGIAVFDSPNTKVVHNTIFMNGQYPNAIEYQFADTTGTIIVNNLSDRPATARNGASASVVQGNIWTATSAWFVNAAAGDLHLSSSATGAINTGVATADAAVDWDNQSRPSGTAPDVGADEYAGTTTPPDTAPPAVSLTAPAEGATISGSVTVTASASDNVGVTSVQFTLDGANLGAPDTAAPYQVSWTSTGTSNGSHTLRAIARDAAGNSTTSSARTVTVSNTTADTTAPTVSLTAPAAGANVSGTVTVSASASDNVGVTSVQFTLDGANLGSADTSSPFQVSWNTTATSNGTHTLRAVARDAAGNSTTSSARTVTVTNTTPDTTNPTVAITSPATGSAVEGTVSVAATATDNVGVIGVQFKVDGVNAGSEDTSAPYAMSWNTANVTAGAHTIQATARDAAGNSSTSSVSVTVRRPGSGVPGDLNDDGQPDLLFRHSNGTLRAWLMQGHTRTMESDITPSAVGSPWQIVSVDDFNGDGRSDLLWQHPASGHLYLWFLNGLTIAGEHWLSQTGTPWRVRATGDLNGDGKPDIIWQHPASGLVYVWLMNGITRVGEGLVSLNQTNPAWRVVSAADMNRDGRADLIWQNTSTGHIAMWSMNGTSVVSTNGFSPAVGTTVWRLQAVADFNGDRSPDFVWHHATTGQLYIWYMSGLALNAGTLLSPDAIDTAWQAVGGR